MAQVRLNCILLMFVGRASASPSIDILITLLSMGSSGWRQLVKQRKENYTKLSSSLEKLAQKHGEKLLVTKGNPISLGNYFL